MENAFMFEPVAFVVISVFAIAALISYATFILWSDE